MDNPREYKTFRAIIAKSIENLRQCPKSPARTLILYGMQTDFIVEFFVDHTPDELKHLLDREDKVPTWEELWELPWYDSWAPGCYGRLMQKNVEKHLYCGSATAVCGGLTFRKLGHIYPKNPCSYHPLLFGPGRLNPDSRFVTFFIMPWKTLPFTQDNMTLIKEMCCIAEAVYTLLLGAYRDGVKVILLRRCPYGLPSEVFDWKGCCSHSPLSEKVRIYEFDTPPPGYDISGDVPVTDEQKRIQETLTTNLEALHISDQLTPEQYEKAKEIDRKTMAWWREANKEQRRQRREMLTEEERAELRLRKRLEMRRYRLENDEEIKERANDRDLRRKVREKAKSHERTRKFRAKQAAENPKPPRPRNLDPKVQKKYAKRILLRENDPYQRDKSNLDKKVSRARGDLGKCIEQKKSATVIQEAKELFAHTSVIRYQFKVAIGCVVDRPSDELFALNWDYMRKNKHALYDYAARISTTNATPPSSASLDALFNDENYRSSDDSDFEYEFPTEEEWEKDHWNEESDEESNVDDQGGVVEAKAELEELAKDLGELELEKEIENEEDLFFDILEIEAEEHESDEESVEEELDEDENDEELVDEEADEHESDEEYVDEEMDEAESDEEYVDDEMDEDESDEEYID